MYTEDIITIVLMGIIAVLLFIAVILLGLLVKKISQINVPSFNRNDKLLNENAVQYSFCKRCGAKYDSKLKKCPECGLSR